MARHELAAEQHDCGEPRSVCSDPDKPWYPQRQVCRKTMERDAANAKYARLHEARPFHDGTFKSWSDKASDEYPYHFNSGVTIWVAAVDYDPDGDWLSTPKYDDESEVDDDGGAPGEGSP